MSVRYYMMVEPSFAGTHWCEQCIQGIRQEAAKNKGLLEEVKTGDEKALEKVLQQERPLLILVGSFVNWMTGTVRRLAARGIHCIMMTAQPPDGGDDASTISMDYRQAIGGLFSYLSSLGKTSAPLMTGGAGTFTSPPFRAANITEAGNMALLYFKKPLNR